MPKRRTSRSKSASHPGPSGAAAPSGSRPIALITGAARRIGAAIATELASRGHDVIITCNSSREEAQALVRRLAAPTKSKSAQAVVARADQLDLNNLAQVSNYAAHLAATLPRLDVLIHNASTYTRSPLASLTAAQLESAHRVNAAAPALLSAALADLLRRTHASGLAANPTSIIAMADIHALGEHGLPRAKDFLAYSMSKAALVEMTRTLARELAPHTRASALALGVGAWPEDGPESTAAVQDAYIKRIPLNRAGTPAEVARAAAWLALEAHYITGEVLRLDGGRSLV